MDPIKNCLQNTWRWTKIRLIRFWDFMKWAFDMVCCCSMCLENQSDENSVDLEKGYQRNFHTVHPESSDKRQMSTGGTNSGGAAAPLVHKLIMVGSGGVGKSGN